MTEVKMKYYNPVCEKDYSLCAGNNSKCKDNDTKGNDISICGCSKAVPGTMTIYHDEVKHFEYVEDSYGQAEVRIDGEDYTSYIIDYLEVDGEVLINEDRATDS